MARVAAESMGCEQLTEQETKQMTVGGPISTITFFRGNRENATAAIKMRLARNVSIEKERPNPKLRYFYFKQSHMCNLCQTYETPVRNDKRVTTLPIHLCLFCRSV